MINFVSGELISKTENSVVLENGGIGYEIFVSTNTLVNVGMVGERVRVFTYLHVKEDELSLYGFLNLEEKELFLKLLTVSGVGPKMALGILSGLSFSQLVVAIKTGDIKLLSTIKGLGKKTAERLTLELKDKVDIVGLDVKNEDMPAINEDMIDEATEALVALGLNKNDAFRLARQNAQGSGSAEDIIRKAFQNLN